MSEIRITGLTKHYGSTLALEAIDLIVAEGEFVTLLGPSGCGKTTTLRCVAGLEVPDAGEIWIGKRRVNGPGVQVPAAQRQLGMVFQSYAVWPHMTVFDNVAYPLRMRKAPAHEVRSKVESVLTSVGLSAYGSRFPGQLSGGQQQRVALARAIVADPVVVLYDEPLSNLDARLRLEARTFLKRLQRDLGVTTVFVTHDQAEALAMSDRMAVMDAGRIRQIGTPKEVFQRPASTFVAGFIGSTPMNLLSATVERDALRVAGTLQPIPEAERTHVRDGEQLVFAARPEYMSFTRTPPSAGAGIEGTVLVVENMGVGSLVSLEVGDAIVQVTVPEGEEPEPGARGWAVAAPQRVLLYRGDDGELVGSDRAEPALAAAGD
jgi:multiple sugar transport system ATP-binding protein